MKGFDLSEKFFREVGLPVIERRLPRCVPRLAVGVAGGSQAHKNDDEVSRDHGWGPGFTVWFGQEDFDEYGGSLQAILDALPKEHDGFQWADTPERTSGVIEVGRYVDSAVGFSEPPASPIDWLRIPEPYLFELTPSRLYHDGPGIVSARLRAFSRYPDDVWKQRMGACLSWCWEWGRKHLVRAEARGDQVSASCYWARFAEYAMRVGFLMSHRYAPYHKWLWTEFGKLGSGTEEVGPLLEEGFQRSHGRRDLVERIEAAYLRTLAQHGYEPADETGMSRLAYPDNELLRCARSVRRTIHAPEVRELHLREELVLPATKATWTWLR